MDHRNKSQYSVSMTQTPINTLTFEAALTELETIVRTLESGAAPLDESISTYERGVALKQHCEQKLAAAQLKIEKITLSPDGAVKTSAFQEE